MTPSSPTPADRRRPDASSVVFADHDPGSSAVAVAVTAYFAELERRFPAGFDGGAPDDGDDFRPPNGCFVLATDHGEPIACGAVRTIDDGIGEIKRMWVHEDWRGAGLGSRMLRELEARSARLGHRVARLDTSSTLGEAIAMYERAGYRRVDRYNDNPYAELFFEKRLP
ncbi:GNAT family N-acetyltransferase [Gordonia sp. (in: high G+C Gram-positive bacteria)]|uniref:GNAT family N-acetyltransferase n=1 Tax=Gordonia sp. (in: high G+C Gram-positive bacteria) TaxID=84139 RepID=UPI0039E3A1FA